MDSSVDGPLEPCEALERSQLLGNHSVRMKRLAELSHLTFRKLLQIQILSPPLDFPSPTAHQGWLFLGLLPVPGGFKGPGWCQLPPFLTCLLHNQTQVPGLVNISCRSVYKYEMRHQGSCKGEDGLPYHNAPSARESMCTNCNERRTEPVCSKELYHVLWKPRVGFTSS
jgi:hypothetical protein